MLQSPILTAAMSAIKFWHHEEGYHLDGLSCCAALCLVAPW